MSTPLQEPMILPTIEDESREVKKKLLQAIGVCAFFMLFEFVFGYISNSLAIMTDAAHLLSDISSYLISFCAIYLSSFGGTCNLSFGYHRAEILGACTSVLCIWLVVGSLMVAATHRLFNRPPVNGPLMFLTAAVGTAANIFMTYILGYHNHGGHRHDHGCHDHDEEGKAHDHHEHHQCHHLDEEEAIETPDASHHDADGDAHVATPHARIISPAVSQGRQSSSFHGSMDEELLQHQVDETRGVRTNLTLKAAYIHALGDLIQNIGVMFAASLIWINPSWSIADPICTILFGFLVLWTTHSILKEAVSVLMEGTPVGVDLRAIQKDFMRIPGVCEVHDLHVWSLSIGRSSLVCHIVVVEENDARRVLHQATKLMQVKHGILHTTIQIDFSSGKSACDTDAHAKCHSAQADCCGV